MKVIKIISELLKQNTYLVVSDGDAIIIDASANVGQIQENLKLFSPVPTVRAILITHAHFDHINELDNLIAKFKCHAFIHKSGKKNLYNASDNLSTLYQPFVVKSKQEIKTFVDGDILTFGSIEVNCFNTPGHTPDCSCFVINDAMFTGDTVFKGAVGRSDLSGSNPKALAISLERIRHQLATQISDFYPGHGSNFNNAELLYSLSRILGEN